MPVLLLQQRADAAASAAATPATDSKGTPIGDDDGDATGDDDDDDDEDDDGAGPQPPPQDVANKTQVWKVGGSREMGWVAAAATGRRKQELSALHEPSDAAQVWKVGAAGRWDGSQPPPQDGANKSYQHSMDLLMQLRCGEVEAWREMGEWDRLQRLYKLRQRSARDVWAPPG
eukprot:351154-Chlamydomonas_euryale.AAC.4